MVEITVDVDLVDCIDDISTSDLICELRSRHDVPEGTFDQGEDRFTDEELDTLLNIFRLVEDNNLITRSEHLDLYDKLLNT